MEILWVDNKTWGPAGRERFRDKRRGQPEWRTVRLQWGLKSGRLGLRGVHRDWPVDRSCVERAAKIWVQRFYSEAPGNKQHEDRATRGAVIAEKSGALIPELRSRLDTGGEGSLVQVRPNDGERDDGHLACGTMWRNATREVVSGLNQILFNLRHWISMLCWVILFGLDLHQVQKM